MTRAWLTLLALGLVTTALAAAPVGAMSPAAALVSALILIVAWIKMRLILRNYLELRHSQTWSRVFGWILGIFALALYGLYLIPLA
ncbi:cytochrome C oxidase subunit IV family protein [Rhodobacteraceae bacterium DSL-40]|uniref:cytochrome C oxidase subunit IV family protein n=1 Tax=Amaricoccus sp. B4 TaxID=3368557 RepID=UPI000DAE09CC